MDNDTFLSHSPILPHGGVVDAHCHLEAEDFAGQLDRVLEDARTVGVVRLITNAVTPDLWPVSKQIAEMHPEVFFAWGIHPWFVKAEHMDCLAELARAREAGAVAIGEIGLDGKIDSPAMPLQRLLFEAQVEVARELELPVVLHCRGAYNELLESLKRMGPFPAGGIIHAFAGSVEIAEECIRYNLAFSMGGALSYHPSKKRIAVLQKIYPDHLLIETDSPDLPPVQVEKPNVPANIRYNLAGAAKLLGLSENEVAAATTKNAMRIFPGLA